MEAFQVEGVDREPHAGALAVVVAGAGDLSDVVAGGDDLVEGSGTADLLVDDIAVGTLGRIFVGRAGNELGAVGGGELELFGQVGVVEGEGVDVLAVLVAQELDRGARERRGVDGDLGVDDGAVGVARLGAGGLHVPGARFVRERGGVGGQLVGLLACLRLGVLDGPVALLEGHGLGAGDLRGDAGDGDAVDVAAEADLHVIGSGAGDVGAVVVGDLVDRAGRVGLGVGGLELDALALGGVGLCVRCECGGGHHADCEHAREGGAHCLFPVKGIFASCHFSSCMENGYLVGIVSLPSRMISSVEMAPVKEAPRLQQTLRMGILSHICAGQIVFCG